MRNGGWSKGRRRALRYGAAIEPFRDIDIFERDGWRCGICGVDVDQALRWPDPMSASIDHVVPLADGGAHAPSNVRCSHLQCNKERGRTPDPDTEDTQVVS